jgi:dGTPase
VSHSKPRGDFFGDSVPDELSLEGQICRTADAVAYLNHDLADAFRAGILQERDLPQRAMEILGDRHSLRIHTMVADIVGTSWAATGEEVAAGTGTPTIAMGPAVRDAVNVLRDFMFANVYVPEDLGEEGEAARRVVSSLYGHYESNPDRMPPEYGRDGRAVVDYVAGMTDRYALRAVEAINPGIARSLKRV